MGSKARLVSLEPLLFRMTQTIERWMGEGEVCHFVSSQGEKRKKSTNTLRTGLEGLCFFFPEGSLRLSIGRAALLHTIAPHTLLPI